MPTSGPLFVILLIALCVVAAWFAIPRVMRRRAAPSPMDERLEYAAHLGKQVDCGPSQASPAERERAGHRELEGMPNRQL